MPSDTEAQADHSWDNRQLILALLTPRTAARPARRHGPSASDNLDAAEDARAPGILARTVHPLGVFARASRRALTTRVPPQRRLHTAIITAAAIVILLAALSGVKYLSADIHPQTSTAATPPVPAVAAQAPLNHDTILTGITAADTCPRDANYSEANRTVDGDLNTAWVCSRVKNKDGQILQISFGRQVTLTQIRIVGGFDATAPDGTDQWPKHRICTTLEVWFPKDLKRDPLTIDTGGDRDWRSAALIPPATVSQLLIRVKETTEPPQPPTPTTESAPPATDNLTTVAISEIQFIGTNTT